MKLYVYTSVGLLTDRWHGGGGLVITTDRDPLDAYNDALVTRAVDEVSSWKDEVDDELLEQRAEFVKKLHRDELPAPARVYDIVEADTERVLVFPNAGCC